MDGSQLEKHQVGVTNAQENNSDAKIARLTVWMREAYKSGNYEEAASTALAITELSKDDLRNVFESKGIKIIHLDHEAFGIYQGKFEPAYDLLVEGNTVDIVDAAREFGEKHAQQAVLVAKLLRIGEHAEDARPGLTLITGNVIAAREAVGISELLGKFGFSGATFSPKRQGAIIIYQTDDLEMNKSQFEQASKDLITELLLDYPGMVFRIREYIVQLVRV